jgi:hypothetical protein
MELAREENHLSAVEEMAIRLELYQNHKAYYE